jgi:transcriptional regulator with XRE-family HTH domain
MEQDNFTVLENKAIGRNISLYRKIRGLKASDIAERLGMKESSYTRYERGEGAITVDMVQQLAEVLNIDPLHLLSVHPNTIIENVSNSPIFSNFHTFQTTNEDQLKMMLKLMESVLALNERLISVLEKKEK